MGARDTAPTSEEGRREGEAELDSGQVGGELAAVSL
jgi:hypothetical protein